VKSIPTPHFSAIDALVRNHRRFLAFLERRVRSRDVAEDLLQDAFVKGLARADTVREPEAAVPWFFRLLRNAVTDYYRSQGAEQRRLTSYEAAEDLTDPASLDPELFAEVCRCVVDLVKTLRPEYAAAVQRVDIEGATPAAWAAEVGITANNASVRLHRARRALAAQVRLSCGTCATHGCLDCHCGAPTRRC
jgi:RNA polymerase sigma factor (sigma-70 family)